MQNTGIIFVHTLQYFIGENIDDPSLTLPQSPTTSLVSFRKGPSPDRCHVHFLTDQTKIMRKILYTHYLFSFSLNGVAKAFATWGKGNFVSRPVPPRNQI